MTSWAAEELASVSLGDARLNRRLIQIVDALSAQPGASVPVALGTPAAIEATYRLWEHPRVKPAAIRAAHRKATRAWALTAGWVLLLQDTTSLDFTSHKALAGVGMLDHPNCRGVFVHSTLAVTLDGVPLGLVAQELYTRDPATRGIGAQRAARPTAEKESQRWLTAFAASQRALWGPITTVTVADREADQYDLWVAPRRPTDHLLLRMRHNRLTTDPAAGPDLRAALQGAPVMATAMIAVPRHHTGAVTIPARTATVTVRVATVTLTVPVLKTGAPLTLQGLLVTEDAPPTGVEPIDWVLLTTLPVPSPDVALLYVEWYTYRWLIERFHYVLKSGCGIEETQVRTLVRLERVVAVYGIVAWRLLHLLYSARAAPTLPCTVLFAPQEWPVLWAVTQPPEAPLPATPPSVATVVGWLAQLGGYRGRASDPLPGIKAIWRGWARLTDLLEGYFAAQRLGTRLVATA